MKEGAGEDQGKHELVASVLLHGCLLPPTRRQLLRGPITHPPTPHLQLRARLPKKAADAAPPTPSLSAVPPTMAALRA
eukprot:1626703-Rhodomonas_salina.4